MPSLREIRAKGLPYTHLRLYGIVVAQYKDDDKLLVQTFPRSLTGAALA